MKINRKVGAARRSNLLQLRRLRCHSEMILNSVKLPHFNQAAEMKTTAFKLPERVVISMSQHGGAPCTPTVKVGDFVKTGQVIGDTDAYVSAPIHSSVTGTVEGFKDVLSINGRVNQAVIIRTDSRQELWEEIEVPVVDSREAFLQAVRKSGAVGLGGAGFPTHVKLNYDRAKFTIDTLVVNGAECEPFITSDYREFMENTEEILAGIKLIMKYVGIEKAVIGIENDKPRAIAKMREAVGSDASISVKALKARYPQGAEKVLVYQATGRTIMEGELPMSAGCIVMNSSTIAFISRYIKTGMPLISRRLTIDGNVVNKPANVTVPVGTMLKDIMDFADLRLQPERIIFGGPMMGGAVYDPEMPVSKTTNAVLMFKGLAEHKTTACIRCGRCVGVCSMNLMPLELEKAYDLRDSDHLKKLRLNTCMDCGACSYICPAKRNLAEKNQLAKQFLRNQA